MPINNEQSRQFSSSLHDYVLPTTDAYEIPEFKQLMRLRRVETLGVLRVAGVENLMDKLHSEFPSQIGKYEPFGGMIYVDDVVNNSYPSFFSGVASEITSYPLSRFVVGMTGDFQWGYAMFPQTDDKAEEILQALNLINEKPICNIAKHTFINGTILNPLFIGGKLQLDDQNFNRLEAVTTQYVRKFFTQQFDTTSMKVA